MSKTSVIIVNWNAREDTCECIESVMKSSYPELEIILVDNASSDGSVEHIRALFPHVTVIENHRNERFARASNKGMQIALESGAQHVFLLNNDAIVEEETVGRLVQALERSSDTGLVGCKILYFSQRDVIWSAGGEVKLWMGITRHRGIRQKDSGKFDVIKDVDYLTGCALMARREVVGKIGFLDPSYYMYGEDADWCLRAKKGGFRVVYVPQARVWHKVSLSSGGEFSPVKIYHKTRSNILLFSRHARSYHWITIPFFSALYLFRLFLKGIASANLDATRAVVRGLKDSVKKTE